MKYIIAIIKTVMIDNVIIALHKVPDFPGAILSDVRGAGKGRHQQTKAKTPEPDFGYPALVRLEVFCLTEQVEKLISVIETSAYTGNSGDGNIFVVNAEQAVQISTGQRGVDVV